MHDRLISQLLLMGYDSNLFNYLLYSKLWVKLEFVLYGQQDGLFLITNNIGLVEDNSLAILTPNVYEYKRLVQKVLNCEVNEENASEQLTALCQKYEQNICYIFLLMFICNLVFFQNWWCNHHEERKSRCN